MKKHLEKIPYLIFTFILYFLISIFYYIFDNKAQITIISLLIIFPIFIFFVSLLFSYVNEYFSFSLSLFIGFLFLIFSIIVFNFDILIYSLLYIFISYCGQGTGFICKKIIKKLWH